MNTASFVSVCDSKMFRDDVYASFPIKTCQRRPRLCEVFKALGTRGEFGSVFLAHFALPLNSMD